MSQHKYAFKFQGKTLGIRDVDQLLRMIESGKLTPQDNVFLISGKRWERICDLPEYAAVASAPAASGPTEDLTALINRELAGLRPSRSVSASQDMDISPFDGGRTIRSSKLSEQRRARRTETLVANRAPLSEGSSTKTALLTAVLILLLGMAVGFFGAFEVTESVVPSQDTVFLQAQQQNTP